MSARISLCIAAFCLSVSSSSAQESARPIAPDIGTRVAAGFITPALADFSDASGTLAAAMRALCGAPTQAELEKAQAVFAQAMTAWGRVSVLRFGPLTAENRFERIFFWPDARGVTLRQVQGFLASQEPVSVAAVAERSVALQGLPALEYVLFGSGSETLGQKQDGVRRCAYGAAIAGNVAGIAQALAADWASGGAFHASFTAPGPDKDPYRSVDEVAGEIVKAAGTALQFTRNAELLPALGEASGQARGRRAPFWRSEGTFAFAAAQLGAVEALVAAAGFVDGPSDLVNGYGRSMTFDISHARDALTSVATAPENAFEEPEDRARIAYATVAMEGAKHTLNGALSGALGLVMGFNALDGD